MPRPPKRGKVDRTRFHEFHKSMHKLAHHLAKEQGVKPNANSHIDPKRLTEK